MSDAAESARRTSGTSGANYQSELRIPNIMVRPRITLTTISLTLP